MLNSNPVVEILSQYSISTGWWIRIPIDDNWYPLCNQLVHREGSLKKTSKERTAFHSPHSHTMSMTSWMIFVSCCQHDGADCFFYWFPSLMAPSIYHHLTPCPINFHIISIPFPYHFHIISISFPYVSWCISFSLSSVATDRCHIVHRPHFSASMPQPWIPSWYRSSHSSPVKIMGNHSEQSWIFNMKHPPATGVKHDSYHQQNHRHIWIRMCNSW